MTAKEKAKELVSNMKNCLFSDGLYDARQCAIICVDEVIKEILSIEFNYDMDFYSNLLPYWNEVKLEIEKL